MPEDTQKRKKHHQRYILTVHAQGELSIPKDLRANSHHSKIPQYTSHHPWLNSIKTPTPPGFTKYVFCYFPASDGATVLNTAAIRNAVSFASLVGLEVGMQVKITRGPLRGMTGILTQANGSARVVVNVDMLRRAISLQVDLGAVAPLNDTFAEDSA